MFHVQVQCLSHSQKAQIQALLFSYKLVCYRLKIQYLSFFNFSVQKREDALLLVQMIAIYYGKDSPRFHKVHAFNHTPDKFDYNELIEEFKSMYTNVQQPSVTN